MTEPLILELPGDAGHPVPHHASCACGSLSLTVTGEPESVYLCGCDACRRGGGSAFAWRARYKKSAVEVRGAAGVWRRLGDAGRWIDQSFCTTCGSPVFQTAEALPDGLVVSAGCFERRDGFNPGRLFRGEGLAAWCALDLKGEHRR